MTQGHLTFPTKREGLLNVTSGKDSASGMLELHFDDPQGRPMYLILPVKAQHELLNAILWERRADIASPEGVAKIEETTRGEAEPTDAVGVRPAS